ncbi:hypothetical protein C8039_15315 [Halogeometricum sp. wsp3]|nr:hypothetical protein C8039_15315 [Halogeometricum sp. wsp3]
MTANRREAPTRCSPVVPPRTGTIDTAQRHAELLLRFHVSISSEHDLLAAVWNWTVVARISSAGQSVSGQRSPAGLHSDRRRDFGRSLVLERH